VVGNSTVKLLEMWHNFIKIFKISHKIYLWQVIVFLIVAIELLLHSRHTSGKLKPHLQAEKLEPLFQAEKLRPHLQAENLERHLQAEKLELHLQAEKDPYSISDVIKAMKWMELPNKMQNLNENPVYAKFNISRKEKPSKVSLLVVVSSAPTRYDRRLAIRETWWKQCKSTKRVSIQCVFMTDSPDASTDIGKEVLKEKVKYKDVEFQNLRGGVEFGKRYLYHLVWAVQNFDFDYFMRMDDDYFICLDRLMNELPLPPLEMFHWGYVHCAKYVARPDESLMLFSRDLVEAFLSQDPLLIKGHPWADEMVATWVHELRLQKIYNHEPRLHHMPMLLVIMNVKDVFKNVCSKYIGVHGSYPKYMKILWGLREEYQEPRNVSLNKYTKECNVPHIFVWEDMPGLWRYEPKRFITNPVWDTRKQESGKNYYVGREEGRG